MGIELIVIAKLSVLLLFHWVFDFIFQHDEVAKNKSKCNKTLFKHVLVYSIPFILINFYFGVFNLVAHFITDYFTSRWTTKLYLKGDRHNFFVVIGLDQFIHTVTLFFSYYYIVGF